MLVGDERKAPSISPAYARKRHADEVMPLVATAAGLFRHDERAGWRQVGIDPNCVIFCRARSAHYPTSPRSRLGYFPIEPEGR